MSTNTLTHKKSGQLDDASWFNDWQTALSGDHVPRAGSSGAPADASGNLGLSTFRWAALYALRVVFGPPSLGVTLNAPGSISAPYALTLPIALPGAKQWLQSDTSGNLSFGPPLAANRAISPMGTTWTSNNSASPQQLPGMSPTITTVGRPVRLSFQPSAYNGSASVSQIGVSGTTIQLRRGGSNIAQWAQSVAPADLLACTFIDNAPSAGTYTYSAWVIAQFGGTLQYMSLVAEEI